MRKEFKYLLFIITAELIFWILCLNASNLKIVDKSFFIGGHETYLMFVLPFYVSLIFFTNINGTIGAKLKKYLFAVLFEVLIIVIHTIMTRIIYTLPFSPSIGDGYMLVAGILNLGITSIIWMVSLILNRNKS